MTNSLNILAVIMARGGSKGLPGKALRALAEKPVIAYTFEQVRGSAQITHSVVSSDDPAILDLARAHHFQTVARPAELATDHARTDDVLRHAVEALGDPLPFAVVMLYGNVPIRRGNMIDRAIEMLVSTGADSVQTIAPVGKMHPYWMFDVDAGGAIKKHVPNDIFRRQDLPALFAPTGAVYVMRTAVLMDEARRADPHGFLGDDRRGLIVGPEDSVDIDTAKDLYVAEAMLRAERDGVGGS
jgi:CMP-N,N'-diacetyllegionaminic acid synthase